jgi:indole-3-glycerol phosphate synthase
MDESPLSKIVASTELAAAERERMHPLPAGAVDAGARPERREFHAALRQPGVSIIAEFKRASPSSGSLGRGRGVAETVRAYEAGGARAISILTEASKFLGSQEDLAVAREACSLPILCKDFIVRDYQVREAAEFGADAILLIAAVLGPRKGQLGHLRDLARELGLDVLVEVRNADELDDALAVGADLVGINNRDLGRLTIDRDTTRRLAEKIPPHVTTVSESGLVTPGHMMDLERQGIDAALIGTALMNAVDPETACRELSQVAKKSSQRDHLAPATAV